MGSIDRFHHFWVGVIVFTVINLLSSQITITLIAIPVGMTLLPDIDGGTSYHRNFLTHGIGIWVVVWLFNPSLLTALVCLGVGLHCLMDITIHSEQQRGFYLIKFRKKGLFRKFKGKQGMLSTLWLFINFIGAVVIVVVQLNGVIS